MSVQTELEEDLRAEGMLPRPEEEYFDAMEGEHEPAGDDDSAHEEAEPQEEVETADEGESGIPADWREIARGYRLSDDAIDKFDSVESLENHLRMIDQQLAEHQWQPPVPQQRDSQSQATELDRQAEKLQLALDDIPEDDPVRKNLERIAQVVDSLQSQTRRFQEEQALRQQQEWHGFLNAEFDAAVDDLDSVLLGKTEKMLSRQTANRQHVFEGVFVPMLQAAAARGERPNVRDIAKKAARIAFPDYFQQQQQKQVVDAVKRQSGKRMGAGRRGPQSEDWDGPSVKDPRIIEAYRRMQRGGDDVL